MNMKRKEIERTERKPIESGISPLLKSSEINTKTTLKMGLDYNVIRLDGNSVARKKSDVKKEGKEEGEKLFQGFMKLLKDSFPPSEIENEKQFRSYFHDEFASSWYVLVAVGKTGEVIGLRTFSYKEEMDLIMLNTTAVAEGSAHMTVSRGLEAEMLNFEARISADTGREVKYAIAEVERPDMRKDSPLRLVLSEKELVLRNEIRPGYHDKVTLRQAVELLNGPFTYLLPIMATKEERDAAIKAGTPLGPEPLMFCIRPLNKSDKEGIMVGELKRLVTWFYMDYLVKECSDVRKNEAVELLKQALATLPADNEMKLPFMKVGETALKD